MKKHLLDLEFIQSMQFTGIFANNFFYTFSLQGINFGFPDEDLIQDCYNNRASCLTDNLEQEVGIKVAFNFPPRLITF